MVSMDSYSKALIEVAASQQSERIIKLLNLEDVLPHLNTREGNWVHKDTLIALIKGVNK